MGPILNGYGDMVKRRYGPSCEPNSNYVINNITTNITCMQVLTIVLLMICNGQNPGSSTSGTPYNTFSKMPPPTSMHLWTRCRVLRVARRSSWRRSLIRTQALLMRATRSVVNYVHSKVFLTRVFTLATHGARRMVRIFFLPYLGNRSKSDPCSYELFCLESHILSFPNVLQILPESPCIFSNLKTNLCHTKCINLTHNSADKSV